MATDSTWRREGHTPYVFSLSSMQAEKVHVQFNCRLNHNNPEFPSPLIPQSTAHTAQYEHSPSKPSHSTEHRPYRTMWTPPFQALSFHRAPPIPHSVSIPYLVRRLAPSIGRFTYPDLTVIHAVRWELQRHWAAISVSVQAPCLVVVRTPSHLVEAIAHPPTVSPSVHGFWIETLFWGLAVRRVTSAARCGLWSLEVGKRVIELQDQIAEQVVKRQRHAGTPPTISHPPHPSSRGQSVWWWCCPSNQLPAVCLEHEG